LMQFGQDLDQVGRQHRPLLRLAICAARHQLVFSGCDVKEGLGAACCLSNRTSGYRLNGHRDSRSADFRAAGLIGRVSQDSQEDVDVERCWAAFTGWMPIRRQEAEHVSATSRPK
jgi:hypothetical protein